jgi:hypothetical protein
MLTGKESWHTQVCLSASLTLESRLFAGFTSASCCLPRALRVRDEDAIQLMRSSARVASGFLARLDRILKRLLHRIVAIVYFSGERYSTGRIVTLQSVELFERIKL